MLIEADRLDAAIASCAEDAFGFLERLVAEPSTVGNEHGALSVFADELAGLGFTVRWIDLPVDIADDPRAGVPQPTTGRRTQVVAVTGPAQGRALLLNGHIDVVPADSPGRWASPPFEPRRDGARLYGRGAGDMKAGFAMGVLALRALLSVAPDILTGPLSFLAAIEEECTGNGTLAAAREGVLAEAVVLLEPTGLDLMVGGVGILWVDVEVAGVSAHAESAHRAVNPVDLVYRLVAGLREWTDGLAQRCPDPDLDDVPSPYNLNVGELAAGDWPSSVPTSARVRLRIGYPRAWTADDAEREVTLALKELVRRDGGFPTEPTVRSSGFRARGYHLDADHPLVRAVAAAHRDAHGADPGVFSLGSTTDARTYLNDFGVPALCYGPAAADIHGVDESVDLDSVVDGARTLARFLAEWYRPGSVVA